MPPTHLSIHEIVAQLDVLSEKLKLATNWRERRTLLRNFRILLDQADQCEALGSSDAPPAEAS
jgi:hypothetical protein